MKKIICIVFATLSVNIAFCQNFKITNNEEVLTELTDEELYIKFEGDIKNNLKDYDNDISLTFWLFDENNGVIKEKVVSSSWDSYREYYNQEYFTLNNLSKKEERIYSFIVLGSVNNYKQNILITSDGISFLDRIEYAELHTNLVEEKRYEWGNGIKINSNNSEFVSTVKTKKNETLEEKKQGSPSRKTYKSGDYNPIGLWEYPHPRKNEKVLKIIMGTKDGIKTYTIGSSDAYFFKRIAPNTYQAVTYSPAVLILTSDSKYEYYYMGLDRKDKIEIGQKKQEAKVEYEIGGEWKFLGYSSQFNVEKTDIGISVSKSFSGKYVKVAPNAYLKVTGDFREMLYFTSNSEGYLYRLDRKKLNFMRKDIVAQTGCLSGDCENGFGKYKDADGSSYVGEWKNGKKDGTGEFISASGHNYEGSFKNDKRHGHGKYTWRDKTYYVGYWQNGKQHGYGEYYGKGLFGILPDKGYWENGKLVKEAESALSKYLDDDYSDAGGDNNSTDNALCYSDIKKSHEEGLDCSPNGGKTQIYFIKCKNGEKKLFYFCDSPQGFLNAGARPSYREYFSYGADKTLWKDKEKSLKELCGCH